MATAGRLTRSVAALSNDDLPRATQRATTAIARLVGQGYASRHQDPDDSRAVVRLTPAGRTRLAAMRAVPADPLPGFDTGRRQQPAAELRELPAAELRELPAALRETAENDTQPRKHR